MDINAFFGLISMISIKKKAYVYERSVPCTLPTDKLSKKRKVTANGQTIYADH